MYGAQVVIGVMATLPAVLMGPSLYYFREEFCPNIHTPKEQCHEIWKTVCSRAVWQPMAFVYLYNVMQIGNAAWKQFLSSVLGFTSMQLNSLLTASYILLYFGVMSYKYFFISWSWRSVYVVTTLLNGVFSLGQLMLIKGYTLGMSPFVFALGDDAFVSNKFFAL